MPRRVAVVDPVGTVLLIQAVDPDWLPASPLIVVDIGPDAEIAGSYAGGVFTPAVPPPPVPASVTRFQARAALAMAGLLDGVETAVAASPNLLARLAWADAQSFERQSPTIASLAAILGLSNEQIDELFQTAAEIVA